MYYDGLVLFYFVRLRILHENLIPRDIWNRVVWSRVAIVLMNHLLEQFQLSLSELEKHTCEVKMKCLL